MPRTLKGEKWEVQYRREVRSIKDGLTASPNGRGLIKATQLILKDAQSNDPASRALSPFLSKVQPIQHARIEVRKKASQNKLNNNLNIKLNENAQN